MRTIRIPKRNGQFRTVVMPTSQQKIQLRFLLPRLQKIAETVCPPGVVHGFWPGRSPVTNASFHRGYQYTVCFDLADFFDSVTRNMVSGVMPPDLCGPCFVDGIARQGLPTSPVVANIAAAPMDHALVAVCHAHRIMYTRYADDLAFSFNSPDCIALLGEKVPALASRYGFAINPNKTSVQYAGAGRRHITGLAVDDELHPTRSAKRRLRAARHKKRHSTVRGMTEWMLLKPPRGWVEAEIASRTRFSNVLDWESL